MAWTTPKTWTSEPLTSSDLNTYIRDNQNDIRSRQDNNADYILDEGSDYTTTSTTFTEVDATNLSLTITTTGGDVLVFFSGSVRMSANRYGFFNIEVDATDKFTNDGHTMIFGTPTDTALAPVTMAVLCEGLSAGSHTFQLKWKVGSGGGTLTMYAGAGTSDADVHPQFWVQEV